MHKDKMHLFKFVKLSARKNLQEEMLSKLTLYHGTCPTNANLLLKNGWTPNITSSGSNMGQSKYLYLTSDPDDALWFAQEKGCDSIVKVSDIPLTHLAPDPEDEAGFDTEKLIIRMKTSAIPSKFVLTKKLSPNHFSIVK